MEASKQHHGVAASGEGGGALTPWSPPVLTVGSVNEVTRAGTTSSRNDGASVFSPS